MEPSPGPWISALRQSYDRLRVGVEPLGVAELERRSYASEWSIAQVLAARSGKPDGKQRKVRVSTTSPERRFTLETGEAVTLAPSDGPGAPELGLSELRLPAEAFVRLIYGRMNEAHTPPTDSAGVDLDELRQLFPGF